jgi:vacuolar-type H+-ATPase subunit I/STV1
LQNVLGTTKEHLRSNLNRVAGQLAGWQVKVTKIKAIYHTMNKFDYDDSRKSLLGQCWCPTEQIGNIREALVEGATRSGTGAQPILTPLETRRCVFAVAIFATTCTCWCAHPRATAVSAQPVCHVHPKLVACALLRVVASCTKVGSCTKPSPTPPNDNGVVDSNLTCSTTFR